MEIYITHWWCCLKPTERAAFSFGASAIAIGRFYVNRAAFDAIWLSAASESPLERRDAFIFYTGLEPGEIPCGEDCIEEVYLMPPDYWAEVYLFSLTDAFICTQPCKILAFTS